ncbi:hypothetical protein BROUX41_003619 [Berkeleyomyces rouxiae]
MSLPPLATAASAAAGPTAIESPPASVLADDQPPLHPFSIDADKARDLHPSTPPTSLTDPHFDRHYSHMHLDLDLDTAAAVDTRPPSPNNNRRDAGPVSAPAATTATTPISAPPAAIATITPPSEPIALAAEPSSPLVTPAARDSAARPDESQCDTDMHHDTASTDYTTAATTPLSPSSLHSKTGRLSLGPSTKSRKSRLSATAPVIDRPRRAARASAVYNLCKLSGTDVHGKRAAKGDVVSGRIRRKSAAAKLPTSESTTASVSDFESAPDPSLASSSVQALEEAEDPLPSESLPPPPRRGVRVATSSQSRHQHPGAAASAAPTKKPVSIHRSTCAPSSTPPVSSASMARRRRSEPVSALQNRRAVISDPLPQNPAANTTKLTPKANGLMSRELRRLRDTDEFAHIDNRPVVHTVWSNGKMVVLPARSSGRTGKNTNSATQAQPNCKAVSPADTLASSASTSTTSKHGLATRTKKHASPADDRSEKDRTEDVESLPPVPKKRPVKRYMEHGLYAGQRFSVNDITRSLSAEERREVSRHKELAPKSSDKDNRVLPSPIFNGLRLLLKGRDFKLPYDVFNPLPPGQSKPGDWRKMAKNRFIGDSRDYWKNTHGEEWQSKCVCTTDDACGESCQNRIMLYECDEENCNIGKEHCTNRAFQNLAERKTQGNKYSMGVEVIKTENRGYGVRANRCFDANQIIVEYTGEIITEEECQRRMEEKYKDNECFYLMSFDQNMILDATTGSIARFVNHSCKPNCRMVKWVVHGQPRMALFAGDDPIMTGDELTYDYKFDPFSSKNMQKCLCGSENCRGWLTSKEAPQQKEAKNQKAAATAAAEDAKRALAKKSRKIILGTAAARKATLVRGVAVKSNAPLASSGPRRKVAAPVKPVASAAIKRKRGVETTDDEIKPAPKRTRAQPSSSSKRRSRRHLDSPSTDSDPPTTVSTEPESKRRRGSTRLSSRTAPSKSADAPSKPDEGLVGSKTVRVSEAEKPDTISPDVDMSDNDSLSSLSDVDLSDFEEIEAQLLSDKAQKSDDASASSEPEQVEVETTEPPATTTSDPYLVDHSDSYIVPTTPVQSKHNKPGRPRGSKKAVKNDPSSKEKPRNEKDIGMTACATVRKRAPQRSRIRRLPNGEIAVNKKWKVVARNPKSLAAEAKANEEASKRAAEAASSRVHKKRPHPVGGVGGVGLGGARSHMQWHSANQEWFNVHEGKTPEEPSETRRTSLAEGSDWLLNRSCALPVKAVVTAASSPQTPFPSVKLAMLNRPPPLLSPEVHATMGPAGSSPSMFNASTQRPRQQPRAPFLLHEPVSVSKGSMLVVGGMPAGLLDSAASPAPPPPPPGLASAPHGVSPVMRHAGQRPPPLSQEALMVQACEARKALGSI